MSGSGQRSAVSGQRPAASVVVPAYNTARCLGGLLFDLAHQTSDEFEVIVSDDGSTDDTAAVVARYPAVRLVRSVANAGPAAARNRGILAARATEVMLFVDADCRVFPQWVARHLAAHRAHPHAIIAGPVRGVSQGYFGQADVFASWYSMTPGRPSGLETEMHVLTTNLSVKRAAFEQLGLLDESLTMCEDAEFVFRAWRAGLTTYFDGTNPVLHRNRRGFRATMRHHFAFGPWALELRRHAPDMPYGWVVPTNLELAALAMPFLAGLHTAWLLRRWLRYDRRILWYLPGIYLLKLAHAAGIVSALRSRRPALPPRIPRLSGQSFSREPQASACGHLGALACGSRPKDG